MKVSVVIVNYKVKENLLKCLSSIKKKFSDVAYEIIIVENDTNEDLSSLFKKDKHIKYIRSEKNLGYGAGNNFGTKSAKGDFIFFLNPDTVIQNNGIKSIFNLFKDDSVGAVAPILLNEKLKPYATQGMKRLTPTRATFSLSFINSLFPNNPISREYFLKDVDRRKEFEAEVIPGTAFIMRKSLFKKIGGFDKQFFLFFEENDLFNRISDRGYKLLMSPSFRVIHTWGESTKMRNDVDKIFHKSRFLYFKKYYGLLAAIFIDLFLRINKTVIIFSIIFALGAFLRLHDIERNTVFIGDQAWFFLSARDMILQHKIPLIGITSSHTWLHQGPLWTYMLALGMLILGFSPVSGSYVGVLFDILSIYLIYRIGRDFFSNRVGIISSFIYSFSSLPMYNAWMPYHTSTIPFFVLLFLYSLMSWVNGKTKYFPLVIICMGLLYNLELSNVIFWPVIVFYFVYGFIKRKEWVTELLRIKMLPVFILAFVVPMIPVIIYDFYNGFPQTLKYAAWFGYKALQFLGFFPKETSNTYSYSDIFYYFMGFYERLIIPRNLYLSLMLLVTSYLFVFYQFLKKRCSIGYGVLFSTTTIALLGLIAAKTPSGAYIPMLIPSLVLCLGVLFSYIFEKNKAITMVLILPIFLYNFFYVVDHKFKLGPELDDEIVHANQILKLADGKKYKIMYTGKMGKIATSVMKYDYLTWYLANNPPSDKNYTYLITVLEAQNVTIERHKVR